jgi:hypothetical protein
MNLQENIQRIRQVMGLKEAYIDPKGDLVDFKQSIFDTFPEDILHTLKDNYSHYYSHNFDWNTKQAEFGDDGRGFRKWLEQNEQDEFKLNLDRIIKAVRSDMILFRRRDLAEKKMKDFEELIIPVFGKNITGRALTKFEEAAVLYANWMGDGDTLKAIEKKFEEAKNVMDSDGNIDSSKIEMSTIFTGDEINIPNFERFIEANPEYQKTFDIWSKLHKDYLDLSLKDTKAFRYPDYDGLKKLYQYLNEFKKGNLNEGYLEANMLPAIVDQIYNELEQNDIYLEHIGGKDKDHYMIRCKHPYDFELYIKLAISYDPPRPYIHTHFYDGTEKTMYEFIDTEIPEFIDYVLSNKEAFLPFDEAVAEHNQELGINSRDNQSQRMGG